MALLCLYVVRTTDRDVRNKIKPINTSLADSQCVSRVSRMQTDKLLKLNTVYIRKQSISVAITRLRSKNVRQCTFFP